MKTRNFSDAVVKRERVGETQKILQTWLGGSRAKKTLLKFTGKDFAVYALVWKSCASSVNIFLPKFVFLLKNKQVFLISPSSCPPQ